MLTIEETIKQKKPFKSEHQRALVNLLYTTNYVSDIMNAVFNEFGVTMKQYNVMRIVKGAKEQVSTCYIRERLLVKNADTSRIVDRMVKKGILVKSPAKHDARLISITLSKAGKDLLKKINKKQKEQLPVTGSLTDKECKQLNLLLNKIRIK